MEYTMNKTDVSDKECFSILKKIIMELESNFQTLKSK